VIGTKQTQAVRHLARPLATRRHPVHIDVSFAGFSTCVSTCLGSNMCEPNKPPRPSCLYRPPGMCIAQRVKPTQISQTSSCSGSSSKTSVCEMQRQIWAGSFNKHSGACLSRRLCVIIAHLLYGTFETHLQIGRGTHQCSRPHLQHCHLLCCCLAPCNASSMATGSA
jgi:hypothetical protein